MQNDFGELMANLTMSDVLLSIYSSGLDAVKGSNAVVRALSAQENPQVDCHVIAIGKAAEAMYQGAKDYLERGV